MKFSISDDRLDSIGELLKETKDIPGDTAELGVFRGGTSRYIAERMHDRIHYAIDSFRGLPYPNEKDGKALRSIWEKRDGKFFSFSPAKVRQYFDPLENIEIIQGFFPRCITLGMRAANYSFVHLDGDIYQTTLDGLKFFWPRMSEGGIIVLDDYDCRRTPGCKIAFDEYFSKDQPQIHKKALPQVWIVK